MLGHVAINNFIQTMRLIDSSVQIHSINLLSRSVTGATRIERDAVDFQITEELRTVTF